jgi:hypothetical protein
MTAIRSRIKDNEVNIIKDKTKCGAKFIVYSLVRMQTSPLIYRDWIRGLKTRDDG